jgi:hypothetical protein
MGRCLVGIALGTLMALLAFERCDDTFMVSRIHVQSRLVTDSGAPEDGFSTMLEAVIAASNRSNPDSIRLDREHVGAIVQCRGKGYFFTHGAGEPGQAPVTFSVLKPRACKLVALWHTHGAKADDREFFSSEDTAAANRLEKPIFMTNHTGKLLVYEPGGPTTKKFATPQYGLASFPRGISVGRLVRDHAGNMIRIRNH